MSVITFCIIILAGNYDPYTVTAINKPVFEASLNEVAALRGQTANIVYVQSGYGMWSWRYRAYELTQQLQLPKPYICLVPGLGGFAGTWDGGFGLLGDWALWALNWGDDSIMPRDYPYWGVYLNRRSQMGAIRHEADHATSWVLGVPNGWHSTKATPWWKLF